MHYVENASDLANLGRVKSNDNSSSNDKSKDDGGKVGKRSRGRDDEDDNDDDKDEGGHGKKADGEDNEDDDDKDKKKTRMSLEKGEVMDAPQQLAQYYMMVSIVVSYCLLHITSPLLPPLPPLPLLTPLPPLPPLAYIHNIAPHLLRILFNYFI